ncbi:MAG: glycosyltransferase family 4 protein [Dehalococcoidia bacterium]
MSPRVFLDVQWKMHSLHSALVDAPPDGYEFVTSSASVDRAFKLASRSRLAYELQDRFLAPLIPSVLVKSYAERFLKRPPVTADLTYACEHLVFRDEAWVAGIGGVTDLVGGKPGHVRRFRALIERRLRSPDCRAIVCYYEAAHRTLEAAIGVGGLQDKVHVVHPAVPAAEPARNGHDRIGPRLLFVGSANIPGQFEIKGGYEALATFVALRRRFPDVQLTIRSDVPVDVRRRFGRLPGLRIIDRVLPRADLEREFLAADVFLLPAHCTVWTAMLEAMSYGLPVVTTDVYANPEIVEDGVNGFLVRRASRVPYEEGGLPISMFSHRFRRAIRRPDPRVVDDTVRQTARLIEDEGLRRAMGAAGRREVEDGRFSIQHRNARLKRIFDAAINGRNGS